MSMLDLLLGKTFPAAKCKTLLKLTISRIKLLRNKREMQLKQMEKEVAQFLQTGQEATARIRVEHIIREQNILAAYEILELFGELLVARLPIIEAQRECPLDLREAIASLIFVASRCSDLPELLHIRNLFAAKYGKEFAAAAMELRPDCGVNRQIIERLSVRAPDADVKLKTLKDIAGEHNVEWDSSATESEFFKLHEDLLDGLGANHVSNGVKVLLNLKENEFHPTPVKLPDKGALSEMTSDVLDLQQVPKRAVSQRTEARVGAGRDSESSVVTSHPIKQISPEIMNPKCQHDNSQVAFTHIHPPSVNNSSPISFTSIDVHVEKQSVAFVSSSTPTVSDDKNKQTSKPSISRSESEVCANHQDVLTTAQAAVAAADRAAAAARAAADLAKITIFDLSTKTVHGTFEGVDRFNSFGRKG